VLGVLGLGLMVSPLFVQVASGTVPQQPKIGSIDVQRTFAESAAGKRTNAAFEKTRKDKQADLDKKKDEFVKAKSDLEKQASVLKPEVLAQKKQELEKQLMALQEFANKLDRDLAVEEQKALDGLLAQAEPIIKDIAIAEGVQLIVDTKGVVWSDPAMDLTDKLIAKMK
jgi:Skp family chaperone for outer membrane proteins